MSIYLSIDGDDIGNKIAECHLNNDEVSLIDTINNLHTILIQMSEHLKVQGFEILFCAADGIVCRGVQLNHREFARYLNEVGLPRFSFSAGIGNDLRTSFFALKYAKATGKNKVAICDGHMSLGFIHP